MKLIGHRGAAGLALENTLESIELAKQVGVDAVEFDLQATVDGKFILAHDERLGRVSDSNVVIAHETLANLKRLSLHNGEVLLGFDDALQALQSMPVIVDVKGQNWAHNLQKAIKSQTSKDITVISFNHQELVLFHKLMPHVPTYAIERLQPFTAINTAKNHGLSGVNLRFWLLNPFSYAKARQAGLDIIIYTVNTAWLARFICHWFPEVSIATDVPDRLQFVRKLVPAVEPTRP